VWKTPDDLARDDDFWTADANDLAITYMLLLESDQRDSQQYLRSAETELAVSFMDLRRPVVERLYRDLVTAPPAPWATWDSPLRQMLIAWGQKGEVYKYWEQQQKPRGNQLEPTPLPSRYKGEWRDVPPVFWRQEDLGKKPEAHKTTRRQMADIDEYNRRYRQFYGLSPEGQVNFDPYLDFKIRMTLTAKLRDAGPAGTAFALTAMLRGGTTDDVMAAVDMGAALDGVVSTAPLKGAGSYGLEPNLPGAPPEQREAPDTPLQPFQMKPTYSRPGAPKPVYRHTIHGGGMDDTLGNQRMRASDSKAYAGSYGGVRAYLSRHCPA
jgi:hypothetical protein